MKTAFIWKMQTVIDYLFIKPLLLKMNHHFKLCINYTVIYVLLSVFNIIFSYNIVTLIISFYLQLHKWYQLDIEYLRICRQVLIKLDIFYIEICKDILIAVHKSCKVCTVHNNFYNCFTIEIAIRMLRTCVLKRK